MTLLAHAALLQRLHHLVERETANFLARRKFLESGKETPNVLLRRHEQEGAVGSPVGIVHADVIPLLERIGTQVEDLRNAQHDKRFLPDREALSTLLGKDNFPLVVTQSH